MTQYMFIKAYIYIGDDTHMTSIKIVQFSRPPIPQSVYVQNSSTPRPWTSNFKRAPPPLQMITNRLKENMIQGWLHAFLYKQHFYKQRQAEIGKKSNKC